MTEHQALARIDAVPLTLTGGRSLQDCLRLGAICAAEVISHYGARPEADLQALVA